MMFLVLMGFRPLSGLINCLFIPATLTISYVRQQLFVRNQITWAVVFAVP